LKLLARIATIVLIASVALLDLGCFALNIWLNRQMIAEGPWAVAQYAEPFRSVLVLVSVLGMSFVVWRAYAGKGGRFRSVATAAIASALSFALCAEAGMGVFYQPLDGELSVTGFPWTRAKLQFPTNEDGVCVRAALDGFYTWYLNGTPLHPRLLPLPLDAQDLKAALSRPMPSQCL
jgi:hypothetical protein